MSQHYNQNHSRKEIETVLNEIKNCVSSGKYIISQNDKRQENIDFINEYNKTKIHTNADKRGGFLLYSTKH